MDNYCFKHLFPPLLPSKMPLTLGLSRSPMYLQSWWEHHTHPQSWAQSWWQEGAFTIEPPHCQLKLWFWCHKQSLPRTELGIAWHLPRDSAVHLQAKGWIHAQLFTQDCFQNNAIVQDCAMLAIVSFCAWHNSCCVLVFCRAHCVNDYLMLFMVVAQTQDVIVRWTWGMFVVMSRYFRNLDMTFYDILSI